jgi:hypothetical protein
MSETLQSISKAVDQVASGNRSNAIDLINDVMMARSSEVLDAYKEILANTMYDEIMDKTSAQEQEE